MRHSDRAPSISSNQVARELARQANCSVEEAQVAYEHELEVLRAQARVTTYLEVFAKRRAQDLLRNRH